MAHQVRAHSQPGHSCTVGVHHSVGVRVFLRRSIALQYEYGDKKEEHEAAAASTAAADCILAADDSDVVGLAAALGVTPGATAEQTLHAVVKAQRQRPRPPREPPSSKEAASEVEPPKASGGAARPRAPTTMLQEQMEEVWNEVFLLEAEGRFLEAAEHQASRLVEIKQAYDTVKATSDGSKPPP